VTRRHYFRCIDSLEAMAVDVDSEAESNPWRSSSFEIGQIVTVSDGTYRQPARCAVCLSAVEYMGEVGADPAALIRRSFAPPCNAACTFAKGPKCDCSCEYKNHGSKILVEVEIRLGWVPVLKAKASQAHKETARATREILDQIEAAWRSGAGSPNRAWFRRMGGIDPFLEPSRVGLIRNPIPIADMPEFYRAEAIRARIEKAKARRVHKSRIAALSAVLVQLQAF
jgi:hypothetical protein